MPSTASEQYLLELTNDARLEPVKAASRYIASYAPLQSRQSDIQGALSYFGVDGAKLLAALQALTPAQPLAFSDVLAAGTRAHDQVMLATNQQTHQATTEAGPFVRIANEGYAFTTAGENVYAYATNPLDAQAAFVVDWGGSAATGGMQSPAGHRVNLMNAGFREAGIGVLDTGVSAAGSVGPELVTEDLGSRGTSGTFLLGVAYADADHDGFYSIGEGTAGLVASVGGTSATSGSSGGWTLATSLAGQQQVTLSGAGLAGAAGILMSLTDAAGNGLNAKIDVIDGTVLHLSNSGIVTGAVSTVAALGLQALTLGLGDAVGRTLLGNDGGDTLTGGGGNDTITGGAGDDVIDGGLGANTLDGGGGTNVAVFDFASTAATIRQSGTGWIVSGPGTTDTLTGFTQFRFTDGVMAPAATPLSVSGGASFVLTTSLVPAALAAQAQAAFDAVNAAVAAGTTIAAVAAGNSLPALAPGKAGLAEIEAPATLSLPAGYTTVVDVAGGPVSVVATAADSHLVVAGGTGALTYSALAGADTIYAGSGNALVFGNAASLDVLGGAGALSVVGGSGGNSVTGGGGAVLMFGTSRSSFIGGAGPATVIGGAGGLTATLSTGGGLLFGSPGGGNALSASSGNATLVGAGAGDVLTASGPNGDVLVAGAGAETLDGSAATGNQVLFAGPGADRLLGGAGNDLILAGSGDATVTGGAGTNNYAFVATPGSTRTVVITDFDPARNAIDLFGYGDAKAAGAAALAAATTAGGASTLHLSDGTRIVLSGAPALNAAYNFYGG